MYLDLDKLGSDWEGRGKGGKVAEDGGLDHVLSVSAHDLGGCRCSVDEVGGGRWGSMNHVSGGGGSGVEEAGGSGSGVHEVGGGGGENGSMDSRGSVSLGLLGLLQLVTGFNQLHLLGRLSSDDSSGSNRGIEGDGNRAGLAIVGHSSLEAVLLVSSVLDDANAAIRVGNRVGTTHHAILELLAPGLGVTRASISDRVAEGVAGVLVDHLLFDLLLICSGGNGNSADNGGSGMSHGADHGRGSLVSHGADHGGGSLVGHGADHGRGSLVGHGADHGRGSGVAEGVDLLHHRCMTHNGGRLAHRVNAGSRRHRVEELW